MISAAFFFLALGAYGWYVRQPAVGRYLVVALCFALGLMAKPIVITLPFVLLLLDYWPLQRFSLGGDSRGTDAAGWRWSLVTEKLPLLLLSLTSAAITIHTQRSAGAIGSVARYLISTAVHRYTAAGFPYGTFTVNVVGCAIFGLIIGFAEHRIDLTPAVRAFFLVGILGGFTTFSSFTFDTHELLRTATFFHAAFNVLGQITLGLAALWLGIVIAKAV